ncbi:MAG: HEAT repeat domain-containing protein, partial [Burkholderiales bacterium]
QLGQASPEAITALVKALANSDSDVRQHAAKSLGQLGQASPEAITALVKALADDNWRVRQHAAESLVKLGQASPEVITALVKALADRDSDVRQHAAESLVKLGQASPETMPALAKAMFSSSDVETVLNLANILSKLDRTWIEQICIKQLQQTQPNKQISIHANRNSLFALDKNQANAVGLINPLTFNETKATNKSNKSL